MLEEQYMRLSDSDLVAQCERAWHRYISEDYRESGWDCKLVGELSREYRTLAAMCDDRGLEPFKGYDPADMPIEYYTRYHGDISGIFDKIREYRGQQ